MYFAKDLCSGMFVLFRSVSLSIWKSSDRIKWVEGVPIDILEYFQKWWSWKPPHHSVWSTEPCAGAPSAEVSLSLIKVSGNFPIGFNRDRISPFGFIIPLGNLWGGEAEKCGFNASERNLGSCVGLSRGWKPGLLQMGCEGRALT